MAKKSFEENLKELEKIVEELESGEVELDKAMEEFNKAIKLSKECSDDLKNAEENISKILKEDGTLEDFEIEE